MLTLFFGALVLATGYGLWRVAAKNQAAQRYLAPGRENPKELGAAELGPDRWAVIAPIRTLRRVVHGELAALASRASTPTSASLAVNAELQAWMAEGRPARMAPGHSKILDILQVQIEDLWEGGHWGCKATLDGESFERRLRGLEELLADSEEQLGRDVMPYRQ